MLLPRVRSRKTCVFHFQDIKKKVRCLFLQFPSVNAFAIARYPQTFMVLRFPCSFFFVNASLSMGIFFVIMFPEFYFIQRECARTRFSWCSTALQFDRWQLIRIELNRDLKATEDNDGQETIRGYWLIASPSLVFISRFLTLIHRTVEYKLIPTISAIFIFGVYPQKYEFVRSYDFPLLSEFNKFDRS